MTKQVQDPLGRRKAASTPKPQTPEQVREQRNAAMFGGSSRLTDLYNRLDEVERGDEDELANNPLDGYIDVTYGISISLVDGGPGGQSTFDELMGKEKHTFASSGTVEDTFDNLYGITSVDVKTVMSITAANPEFARSIEIKAELIEPHGLSFDRNIRSVASGMGYGASNPAFYIWRIDLWWNGYDPRSGQWSSRIPFNGFRGEKVDTVTHFCHLITLEASVKPDGTVYQLSFVPVSFIATRPEMMIMDAMELQLKLADAKLGKALDELASGLTKIAEKKKVNHKYEIKYPEAFNETYVFDGESKDWAKSADIVILNAPARSSIVSFIMNILNAAPEVRSYAANAAKAQGKDGTAIPNMSFVVYTDVDYSTSTFNQKSNSYEGITFRFNISPYFEWKSSLPNKDIEGSTDYALRNLRRVYNYAWTSENTEVLEFNATVKLFYFINEGYGGLTNPGYADASSSNVEDRTPDKADQQFDEQKRSYDDRDRPQWQGGSGGAENAPSGDPLGGRGTRTSDFGMRKHPIDGVRKPHRGVDIAAPAGTPVFATQDGVASVDDTDNSKAGKNIRIEGGRYDTRYLHLSRTVVKNGQRIRKGDIIGYVGSTGHSTGPHLHYEVIDGDKQVDPDSFDPDSPSPTGMSPPPFSPNTGARALTEQGERNSTTRGEFGGDGKPALGRNVPFTSAANIVGTNPIGAAGAEATEGLESYQLSFERRVGPDLVKLEGMRVRGDPRWMLGHEQMKTYNIMSSLIRVNVFQPDQSEYMSGERREREADLSLGGWYELISIDHSFKDGSFTQSLTGYRVLGLNPS